VPALHPAGAPPTAANARPCSKCHDKDMMADNDVVKEFKRLAAPGYRKAMHTLCVACHRREAANPRWKKPDLYRCATCHRTPIPAGREVLLAGEKETKRPGGGSSVTSP
jgi:Class III cytochrome C family.